MRYEHAGYVTATGYNDTPEGEFVIYAERDGEVVKFLFAISPDLAEKAIASLKALTQ